MAKQGAKDNTDISTLKLDIGAINSGSSMLNAEDAIAAALQEAAKKLKQKH